MQLELQAIQIGRNILNENDLINWSKRELGFSNFDSNLHTTIAYSKSAVDTSLEIFNPMLDELVVTGGRRELKKFKSGHLVLTFESPDLHQRWNELRNHGASWDFQSFIPHVTLAYNIAGEFADVQPYQGDIVFGPEYLKKIKTASAG